MCDPHLSAFFGRVKVKSVLYYRVWNGSYTLLGHEASKFLPKLVYSYCTSFTILRSYVFVSWCWDLRNQLNGLLLITQTYDEKFKINS